MPLPHDALNTSTELISTLRKKLKAQVDMLDGLRRMEETDILSPLCVSKGQTLKNELSRRVALLNELLSILGSKMVLDLPDDDMPFRHWLQDGDNDNALSIEKVGFWTRQLREKTKNEEAMEAALSSLAGSNKIDKLTKDQLWNTTDQSWQLYLAKSKHQITLTSLAGYENFMPLSVIPDGSYKSHSISGKLSIRIIDAQIPNIPIDETLIAQIWIDNTASEPMKLKRNGDSCDLAKHGVQLECNESLKMEILLFNKMGTLLGFTFFRLSWLEDFMNTTFDRTLREKVSLIPEGFVNVHCKIQKNVTIEDEPHLISRQKVIKRKLATHLGHEFVPIAKNQSSLILKCSQCTDLIYAKMSVNCRKCRLTCHKDCTANVFVRCIADPNYSQWEDMMRELSAISHPHRMENATFRTPTFCNHCGRLIPIGNVASSHLKCQDCGICLHVECEVYLLPYCKISRERARNIAKGYLKRYSNLKSETQSLLLTDPKLAWKSFREEDFEYLNVIGKGNFGKVMLARHRNSGQAFALKILKKSQVIENDEMESLLSEHNVLSLIYQESFPFLVTCYGVFQTETRIFFVMEFICGGDLMFHIQKHRFTEDQARFLTAEVLLAIEFLHKRGVIYRDLKLDNILLGLDGHIRVADYGLCKFGMNRMEDTTMTFCGTPEFMAPEILQEKPYGKAVDWWAFGVLLFELLFSQAPFHGKNETEVFKAILTARVGFPKPTSVEVRDLLQKLLIRNPEQRLGSGKDGIEAIKGHPFFASIDWNKLLARKIDPPFKPSITNPVDISNFEKQFTEEVPILTPIPSRIQIPAAYETFFASLDNDGKL